MKKIFDTVEMELIVFSVSDIITTSGDGNDDPFPGGDDIIEY